jgi:hypothetical protein
LSGAARRQNHSEDEGRFHRFPVGVIVGMLVLACFPGKFRRALRRR